MTALSYNDGTGMTTRLFNVDTRAGLHVGTVGELVHQGLHLNDDYKLGRNTLLEEGRSSRACPLGDLRSYVAEQIYRHCFVIYRHMLRCQLVMRM